MLYCVVSDMWLKPELVASSYALLDSTFCMSHVYSCSCNYIPTQGGLEGEGGDAH